MCFISYFRIFYIYFIIKHLPLHNLPWRIGLPVIHTGINRFRILICHLPEGILDNAGGIMFIAHQNKVI